MSIRVLIASLILLASCVFTDSAAAQSAIGNKLADSLDAMVNITDPTVANTNRRTIITGGSISLKMPSQSVAEGFAFRPPSMQVGCGGIDAFFGSFSMVSKEQLVQALRGIVTGAIVYAFRVALQALCPSCESVMTSIGDLLSAANRMLSDTCNTTVGMLESAYPSATVASKFRTQIGLSESGVVADRFEGWVDKTTNNMDKFRTLLSNNDDDIAKNLPELGNHVYRAAKFGESQAFNFMPDFNNYIEEIISITGTVIVCQMNEDSCPETDSSTTITDDGKNYITQYKKPILSLEHLVKGFTSVHADGSGMQPGVWRCNTHAGPLACMDMQHEHLDASFIGMEQRIRNVYLGTASSPGIITKLRYDPSSSLTTEEADFLKVAGPLTGKVFNLAKKDPYTARGFVMDFADVIAADLVYAVLSESFVRLQIAASTQQNNGLKEALDKIDGSMREVRSDYMKLVSTAQARDSTYQAYLARMEAVN